MTFKLPKTPAIQRVISSLPPKAVKETMPENLTSQSRTTNPVRTFGQNTLGNSFARLSTPNPPAQLDYLANTTLPVALTVPGGSSTTNPIQFSQQMNAQGIEAVQNKVNELINPYGINI